MPGTVGVTPVDYRREHNWEQQREQLSALLDNQLGKQERAALEAHVRDCAECQAELASLQQTRALLRALPQPALPRNFTLSLDVAVEEPPQVEPAHQPAPQPAQRPRSLPRAREQRWKRPVQVMQWLSTVAAVVGLVLLCSSAFSSIHLASGGATSATTNSAASAPQATSYRTPPIVRTDTTFPAGGSSPVNTQGTPASPPTSVPMNTTPGGSSGETPNPNTQWFISATGLGILLLILSVCGFVIARILRRQW
ncbi:MAG TPA: zf-HC2 domain-containing protein [Ktedonobacterales bacterium]|nr:zf-HC2 domain-containing protein [Ktedonobacterales bacterium]